MINLIRLIVLTVLYISNATAYAAQDLSVFTSENPESNALKSFIVIPSKMVIPEGISSKSQKGQLKKQLPFKIEILDPIANSSLVQWEVTIPSNHFGRIRVRSDFSGKKKMDSVSTVWTSFKLDPKVNDRHILLFEPRQQKHKSSVYKKGKPTTSQTLTTGGGTEFIYVPTRNPRLRYLVEARILNSAGAVIKRYNTSMQMDNKDLVRQEYINHYRIQRSSPGDPGKLPIPTRSEIELIPPIPAGYAGNPLSESEYEVMIEDGATKLAGQILRAYSDLKNKYRQSGGELKDLNGNPLTIPDSQLWLSSGWRNPERNEWYSDALNGAHQLGIALDIMPNEIPRQKNAAIVYWVLWNAVKSLPNQQKIFAQLEALTIPIRANSFKVDIEPRNGIPDAYDKADHLHINLLHD